MVTSAPFTPGLRAELAVWMLHYHLGENDPATPTVQLLLLGPSCSTACRAPPQQGGSGKEGGQGWQHLDRDFVRDHRDLLQLGSGTAQHGGTWGRDGAAEPDMPHRADTKSELETLSGKQTKS